MADSGPDGADLPGRGEWEFIRLLRRAPSSKRVRVGIGDDAAVLTAGTSPLVVTVDAMVAGVHFDTEFVTPTDVGWRAVGAAVSDIAAMGAEPTAVLVALAWDSFTGAREVMDGACAAGAKYGCEVVGGDTVAGSGKWVSVTVLGDAVDGAVLRGNARVGDSVWLTAPCGGAARGLQLLRSSAEWRDDPASRAAVDRFLRPEPRVEAGRAACVAGATAMIDVSDGLAHSLAVVAQESGVGIDIDEVAVFDGATVEQALYGGEDFELVICLPAGAALVGLGAAERIGRCTAVPGVRVRGEQIDPRGYEHTWRVEK